MPRNKIEILVNEINLFRDTLPEYRRYEKYQWMNRYYDVVKAALVIQKYSIPVEDINKEAIDIWTTYTKLNYKTEDSNKVFLFGATCNEMHI